jgi:hypothetical protein
MPVRKCSNGKYRIGSGPCMYHSKEKAERAYVAYLAKNKDEDIDSFGIPKLLSEASVDTVWSRIESTFNFEKWFKATEHEDNFAGYVSGYEDEEEAKERSQGDFDPELQSWDEFIKEQAAEWVDSRMYNWREEFHREAKTDENGLIIYRCISIANIDEFIKKLEKGKYLKGYKGIGIFWAWNEKKAECHWGKGGNYVTIVATVSISSIDFPRTVYLNLNPALGEDEAEIRLKEHATVKILRIDDKNDQVIKDFETPLKVVASDVDQFGVPEITERKQVGTIYHFTSSAGLRGIVDTDYSIHPDAGPRDESAVSFTRDAKLNFRPTIYRGENPREANPAVRLVVDGEKMSDRYKVTPHNDFGGSTDEPFNNAPEGSRRGARRSITPKSGEYPPEAEERVILPRHESLKVKPYLISVDIRKRYEEKLADVISTLERDGIKVNLVDQF